MPFLYVPNDADTAGPGTTLEELLIWKTGSRWKGLGWRSRARASGAKDLFSGIRVSEIPCEPVRAAAPVKDKWIHNIPPLVLPGAVSWLYSLK